MSAKQVLTPTPICEACWIKKHARWEPESVDDTGNILMRLKGIDLPDKVSFGSVETCNECTKLTVAGFYELRDPRVTFQANLPLPAAEDSEMFGDDEQ